MHAPTESERPLKVLNAARRQQFTNYNQTCRDLQAMGVRLNWFDMANNRLVIADEDGRVLVLKRLVIGLTQKPSAGSTFYTAQFQGVTLEWREPISHSRPADYAGATTH